MMMMIIIIIIIITFQIVSFTITGQISTNTDMRTGLPVDCMQFAM